ncbi:MAG: hypothetical protein V4439_02910 [Patescibacteria group bacterium]
MFGKNTKKEAGSLSILGIVSLLIILIVILSYFNINLKSVVEDTTNTSSVKSVVQSPQTADNVNYVTSTIQNFWNDLWDNYLSVPFTNFYNNFWLPYIWNPFWDNMKRIQNGQPTDIQNAAPTVYFGNNP